MICERCLIRHSNGRPVQRPPNGGIFSGNTATRQAGSWSVVTKIQKNTPISIMTRGVVGVPWRKQNNDRLQAKPGRGRKQRFQSCPQEEQSLSQPSVKCRAVHFWFWLFCRPYHYLPSPIASTILCCWLPTGCKRLQHPKLMPRRQPLITLSIWRG